MPRLSIPRAFVALGITALIVSAGALLLDGLARPQATQANGPEIPAVSTTVNFNRQIRPLLSDRCFPCHGPDINKRISGLRLDKQAEAFGPLPKHPNQRAFVPGHPEQSMAYLRIISTDAGEVMPPAKSHLKLDRDEQELIKQWIFQGAHWQEHWAFVKPQRPTPPIVTNAAWPHNDIDRFVLANLEQQGLRPSRGADKPTLIRRVSLDLTGIPPTLAEVDAFVADTSPNAYEKVVDRLLASPRYGEQMAATWLDYARYADSHGFQNDPERYMWHWRDWVINAYNSNMPFDEFTIEQLAGDLLPNATDDQKIATGFNRNHRINAEAGSIDEEWHVETVIDRVETTSATWMGLTMGCCRCHDHKFDPITQKEFYQFCGFFNSINERGTFSLGDRGANQPPLLHVYTAEDKARNASLNATIANGEAKQQQLQQRLPELEQKWIAAHDNVKEPEGLLARFPLDGEPNGVDAKGQVIAASVQGNGRWTDGPAGKAFNADGKGGSINAGDALRFERNDSMSVGAWVNLRGNGCVVTRMEAPPHYRGFDIQVHEDGKLAAHLIHDWATQDALHVVVEKPLFPRNRWVHVMATYDGASKASGLKIYVDGKAQETKAEFDNLRDTILTTAPLQIGTRVGSAPLDGAVADVRFYSRVLSAAEVQFLATEEITATIIRVPADRRTVAQTHQLAQVLLAGDPEYAKATAEIDAARRELVSPAHSGDGPNTTMIMEELPKPRDTFVLIRGQYDKHGDKVEPGVPSIFPPLPAGLPANRLTLAKWIVDPANPLTARVQANRLWEKFFGVGIVKTTENMGTQSQWPSNPELLDFLATEMIRLKWDLKAFQKEIVMSAAYQQDSAITTDLLERDPENRLIARGPRFRLPAETVRDQALAIAGLLVDKIGGPSAKPYEPADLWDYAKAPQGNLGNLTKYNIDHGDGLYRRSLYTFIKRTMPPPNLMVFDMSGREVCTVKRARTNTPLQALDLLNDPTYIEAARVLGEHMMTDGGSSPQQRLAWGFRRATCRQPSDDEIKVLLESFSDQVGKFRADRAAAEKFVNIGESKRNETLDVIELAAYAMTASAILNLDETVTKQ
jgi:hypothetical protein